MTILCVNRRLFHLWLIVGIFVLFAGRSAFSQGTAFFYQGQLASGGAPANGYYNFTFVLYNAASNGAPVSGSLTNYDVPVSNGLFTTTLDFGPGYFTGPNLWLDIGVCTTNVGVNFTMLSPLQPVLPVPYAIFASSTTNLLGTLPASQISGTLPATAFAGYTNTVALTNSANLFSGTFSGNGAAVTNVSVTNLTGVLADSQLPTNTAFLNSNQTFTASNSFSGVNTFTNLGNNFSGSFFGNGLVGWVPVSGTTVQAQIDHGYVLTNSQIVTVTLPISTNVGDIVRVAGVGATGWQVTQAAGQSVLGNLVTYGKSWTQTPPNGNWTSIASSSDGAELVAANYGSGIYLSANSGASWSLDYSTAGNCVGVASSSSGTILAAAVTNSTGYIYLSTNSGSSWEYINGYGGTSSYNWSSVALSSSGNLLLAANAGTGAAAGLYIFSGTTFVRSSSYGYDWTCVASSASGSNLIAAAYNNDIYLSANAGISWTPVSNPGTGNWRGVASSSDGTKLAAAAYNGGIYTSINSGTSWSKTTALTEDWTSLACSSDGGKLVATAYNGGVYLSANWGTTWQLQANLPTLVNWYCAAISSGGSTLAAGIYNSSSGGIYVSESAAQTATTTGTNGYISGGQGTAVELQYIGNNQWMPVSSAGTIWGN